MGHRSDSSGSERRSRKHRRRRSDSESTDSSGDRGRSRYLITLYSTHGGGCQMYEILHKFIIVLWRLCLYFKWLKRIQNNSQTKILIFLGFIEIILDLHNLFLNLTKKNAIVFFQVDGNTKCLFIIILIIRKKCYNRYTYFGRQLRTFQSKTPILTLVNGRIFLTNFLLNFKVFYI